MSQPSVFIDGEAGTTGLGIRERLGRLPVTSSSAHIDPERIARTRTRAGSDMMAEVDAVVLCLPDDCRAARGRCHGRCDGRPQAPKLLDASTAHRVGRRMGVSAFRS